jgi:hypothetical protein
VYHDDYLMRMIRQVAEAIARIAGQRKAGDVEQALVATEQLYDELGVSRELLDVVDSATLADVLGRGDKIRAVAWVCWEDGHLHRAKGDPEAALARFRRAHELMLEARARDPQPDDDAAILEMSRIAPAHQLAARYRGV